MPVFTSLFGLCLFLTIAFLVHKNRKMSQRLGRMSRDLSDIFDNAPVEIYLKDMQGRYLQINRQFEKWFNVRAEDVIGLLPENIHDLELAKSTRDHDLKVLSTGKTFIREEAAETAFGLKYLNTIKFPTMGKNGEINGLGAVVTDITEQVLSRKRTEAAEQELKQKNDMLSRVLGMSGIGCWTYDKASSVVHCDKNFCLTLGQDIRLSWPVAELFSRIAPDYRTRINSKILRSTNNQLALNEEFEVQFTDKKLQWLRLVGGPVWEGGHIIGYTGFVQDVSAFGSERVRLVGIANTDYLTGVLNRRGLASSLEIGSIVRGADRFVLEFDLDNFKATNDIYGHPVGDMALRVLAGVLSQKIWSADCIARVGGDEFILVTTPDCTLAEVLKIAQGLLSAICEPFEFEGVQIPMAVSVGISQWRDSKGQSFDKAMHDANLALRAAKKQSAPKIVEFTPQMRMDHEADLNLAKEIRQALATDEIDVYFQPQLDIFRKKLVGIEALVRWHHPERGLLRAGDFIHCAAEHSLLQRIDKIVLEKSCIALKNLSKTLGKMPRMSINMSTGSLSQPNLVTDLKATLQAHGLGPEHFGVEITEDVFLGAPKQTIVTNVSALKQAGFSIELDDFGTGYASLSTLIELPIDRIKIDQRFVDGIDVNMEKRRLSELIIEASKTLGATTVAEGIETEAQLAVLREIGCDAVQGYLISTAIPEGAFEIWMKNSALQIKNTDISA